MTLDEMLAQAAAEGADLVKVVEDKTIRALFRVDGYLAFRHYGDPASPPPWRAGLPQSDGPLQVPDGLSGVLAGISTLVRRVHDAQVWDIALAYEPSELRRREVAAAEKAERERVERESREAEWAAWQADRERPVDPGKLERLRGALADAARPCVPLAVLPGSPRTGEGQLGGTPRWPVGEPWPVTRDGGPMEFLAQVDLAGLPGLPDMPDRGVLQVFYDTSDGGDITDIHLAWRPDGVAESCAADLLPMQGDGGALEDPTRPRRLVPGPAFPDVPGLDEGFEAIRPDMARGYGAERCALREEQYEREPAPHYVGGWPHPCQPSPYGPDTVVLLRLGSQDGMMWSDGGDFHVLIERGDLRARDFGKAWAIFDSY